VVALRPGVDDFDGIHPGMAAGCGIGGMNGGFEVLGIGGERHPDGAWDGSSFGNLSGA
jgi:hypothetical protein